MSGWFWLSWAWPVVVAVPGFVAFWWQWNDRRLKAPHVEIRTLYNQGFGQRDGWVPVQFFIRNDASVPITITRLAITRPKGVEFAAMNQSSNSPDMKNSGSIRILKWRVEPVLYSAGRGELWSTQTKGFLGSTLRSISDAQLSIRITFSEMSATRRQRTVRITTDPITLPVATRRIAS